MPDHRRSYPLEGLMQKKMELQELAAADEEEVLLKDPDGAHAYRKHASRHAKKRFISERSSSGH